MLNIGEGHVSMALPRPRAPYRKHLLTLSRGATGRLKVEIESWRSGEEHPSRIEMGPLHKLARTLTERYQYTGDDMVQTLQYLSCSARLIAEAAEDLRIENIEAGHNVWALAELEKEAA